MKHLLVLAVLLAVGAAGSEETPEPTPDLYFENTGEYQIKFWEEPECPEDWGKIVIELLPSYEYETVTVECGRVVEPPR